MATNVQTMQQPANKKADDFINVGIQCTDGSVFQFGGIALHKNENKYNMLVELVGEDFSNMEALMDLLVVTHQSGTPKKRHFGKPTNEEPNF